MSNQQSFNTLISFINYFSPIEKWFYCKSHVSAENLLKIIKLSDHFIIFNNLTALSCHFGRFKCMQWTKKKIEIAWHIISSSNQAAEEICFFNCMIINQTKSIAIVVFYGQSHNASRNLKRGLTATQFSLLNGMAQIFLRCCVRILRPWFWWA